MGFYLARTTRYNARRTAAALGILVFAIANPLQAQNPVIGDLPKCSSCVIELQSVVSLGDDEGPGALSGVPRGIVRDRQGRYWVASSGSPPVIFDHLGRYVATVGRLGSGPGEFVSPRFILSVPGDSILVIDPSADRASVFSPQLGYVRAFNIPQAQILAASVIRWPDQILINGLIQTPNHVGWPFHVLNVAGGMASVTKSFGPGDGTFRAGDMIDIQKQLTPVRSGRFWFSDVLQYDLKLSDSEGRTLMAVSRRPPWFAVKTRWGDFGTREKAPSPRVQAIYEDSLRRLWVYALVASDEWRQAWRNIPQIPTPPSRPVEVPAGQYHPPPTALFGTRIEILDPNQGSLFATVVVRDFVVAVLENGDVVTYTEGTAGGPRLLVKRTRVTMR